MSNLEKLYTIYPFLKEINNNNNGIIEKNIFFKKLMAGEYLKTNVESCVGFLFILNGSIKIQRITDNGEETNIHNIKQGGFCHEALSCFHNLQPLNIEGIAIQDSEIALLPSEIFTKYVLSDNSFLIQAYKDLYVKFNEAIKNKEEKIHDSLERRIVKYLLRKNSNTIYATQKEIAFEIDSAREAVSRKLKVLESLGYIKIMRGKIQVIKNLNELL